MKVFRIVLSLVLVLSFAFSAIPVYAANDYNSSIRFSDVPTTHWAYDDIMYMASKGYIVGTTDIVNGVGKFEPDTELTVAQLLTILTRVFCNDDVNAMNKVNKTTKYWYENYYYVALNNGISFDFYFEALDKLNYPCTREEMSYFIIKTYENVLGNTCDNLISVERIPDYRDCSPLYLNSVLKAYSMGILAGMDNQGTFRPNYLLTRAQACAVIRRLLEPSKRQTISSNNSTYYSNSLTGEWYAYDTDTFVSVYDTLTITSNTMTFRNASLSSGNMSQYAKSYDYTRDSNKGTLTLKSGSYKETYKYTLSNGVLKLTDSVGNIKVYFSKNSGDYSVADLVLTHAKMTEMLVETYYKYDDYAYKILKYNRLLDELDREKSQKDAQLKDAKDKYEAAVIEKAENPDSDVAIDWLKGRYETLQSAYDIFIRQYRENYKKWNDEVSQMQAVSNSHRNEMDILASGELEIINQYKAYLSEALGENYAIDDDLYSTKIYFQNIRNFMGNFNIID